MPIQSSGLPLFTNSNAPTPVPGRSHFTTDPAELDTLERATRAQLANLAEQLSGLEGEIAAAELTLRTIAQARTELA